MLEYLQSNMDIVLTQIIALICNKHCALQIRERMFIK